MMCYKQHTVLRRLSIYVSLCNDQCVAIQCSIELKEKTFNFGIFSDAIDVEFWRVCIVRPCMESFS